MKELFLLLAEPYTKYKFWVKSFTWKHEGLPSRPPLPATTDVSAPSAPAVANLTCLGGSNNNNRGYSAPSSSSLLVAWTRPVTVHGAVDVYEVEYAALESGSASDRVISRRTVTVDARSQAFRERKVCALCTAQEITAVLI